MESTNIYWISGENKMIVTHDVWTLYKMTVSLKGAVKRDNYFFSKRKNPKEEWMPIETHPSGYEIYQLSE